MATKKSTTEKKKISTEMFYIYGIFLKNKCLYIGSTEDTDKRWKQHSSTLSRQKHSNKSLQKQYDIDNNFEYKIIMELPTDNTLIKFFCESLVNSIYKPSCCKAIIAQGRMRVILQRCDSKLAEKILECIKNYYN